MRGTREGDATEKTTTHNHPAQVCPICQDAPKCALALIPLEGAADHGVSEAIYLRDPDDNGVELYWDRPSEAWPRTPQGELAMYTAPLDLASLLREAESDDEAPIVGGGPRDL